MEMQQIIGMLARINATMEEILCANRAEIKMDAIQEKKDVNLRENMVEIKDARKEMTACQDSMKANIVKMEAAVEWQETPNEDVAIYSLRECRKETMPRNDGGTSGNARNQPQWTWNLSRNIRRSLINMP
jgi:hypothetical protein